MSILALTAQQISASLEEQEGELRLDSRIMVDGFGLKNHTDYRRDILEKYESKFEELGVVIKPTLETGEIVWYLNQDQANFAGTLARNTEKAVAFKLNLIKGFKLAKESQYQPPQSQLQLPSRELAVETAVAIDRIQDILSKSNPRLAQVLIDCAMNDVIESNQLKLSASSEFPADRWYGIVQIAEKMGVTTNSSTRVKLGNFVGKLGLERAREERLCNGQMTEIWCYRDDGDTRAAITEFTKTL
jgi:phage regulator Rha-like protein